MTQVSYLKKKRGIGAGPLSKEAENYNEKFAVKPILGV